MSLYIAVEGIDGSGKSTQARRLAEHLSAIQVAEPGGTPFALALREIVKNPDLDMGVEAETLLFASARADLLRSVVKPSLKEERDVVSDRTVFSSLAYQGFRDGRHRMNEVWEANNMATEGWRILPDLVLQIDLDAETALSRRSGRGGDDRMEAVTNAEELIEGFNIVRSNLHTGLKAYSTTWVKIDGLGTEDEVFEEMVEAVERFRLTPRSHAPEFVMGDKSMERVVLMDAPAFEDAEQIMVAASGDTRDKGTRKKTHFIRSYRDPVTERRGWVSLCRNIKPVTVVPDTSEDPIATCLRCQAHASAVAHLDFNVDSGVNIA